MPKRRALARPAAASFGATASGAAETLLAPRERDGRARRVFERGGGDRAGPADGRGVAAEKVDDDGLARLAREVEDAAGDGGGGGLGDQDDDARPRVGREALDASLHHEAAHALVEVVAAHADHLRAALAEAIDEAADLLEPRAGGADEADGPAPDGIGEAERHAVEDRGAAVRAHDEELLLRGEPLEEGLVGDGDVVAEDEDVEPALERLERLRGRVGARGRDDGEIGVRELARRLGDAAGDRLVAGQRPVSAACSSRRRAASARARSPPARSAAATATTRSFGPAALPAASRSPAPDSSSRLAGVPIMSAARLTPATFSTRAATRISSTESRYVSGRTRQDVMVARRPFPSWSECAARLLLTGCRLLSDETIDGLGPVGKGNVLPARERSTQHSARLRLHLEALLSTRLAFGCTSNSGVDGPRGLWYLSGAMEVTVYGAGAIGGTTGAALARAGHDVLLVDSHAPHVEAINAHGLTIEREGKATTTAVRAVMPADLGKDLPLVLLAVKSHHTPEALDQIVPRLRASGTVVSLQNGLSEELIAQAIGPQRTVGCLVNWAADWIGPGRILHGGHGAFVLGELDGRITPRVRELAGLLSALVETPVTDNIWGYKWAKLIYGALLFGTAVVDAHVYEVVERSPDVQRVLIGIVGEGLAVADKAGVRVEPFDEFDPAWYRAALGGDAAAGQRAMSAIATHYRAHTKTKTGIWRDLAVRKRKTEVDGQLGVLAQKGESLGVAMPLTRGLIGIIRDLEDGRRRMDWKNFDPLVALAKS